MVVDHGTDLGIGRILHASHQGPAYAVRINLRLTTIIKAASILSSWKTLWNSTGSFLNSSSYLYSLQVSRTRQGKFCEIVQYRHGTLNTQGHRQGHRRAVNGYISHCSVVVRDGEVYLYKDVIDHLINLLIRHGFGILCHFDDILAKSLDIECQHVL